MKTMRTFSYPVGDSGYVRIAIPCPLDPEDQEMLSEWFAKESQEGKL